MAYREYARQQEERISKTPEGVKRLEETKKQIQMIKSAPWRALKAIGKKIKQWTSDGWMFKK